VQLAAAADFDTAVGEIEAQAQAELFNHPEFMAVASGWISQVTG
jgi:enoyl-CoA hydratase